MRINLLKRIESSIDSFRLTLNDILAQIENRLELLKKKTQNRFRVYNGILIMKMWIGMQIGVMKKILLEKSKS